MHASENEIDGRMGRMVDGDGYRFEKVVDAGRRVKRGIESFFNRMAGKERCRTFLSETGKPCSTFFRASALKSRDSDIFPVASIHFDYRHFQLFYSLLIKTGGEEDVRGFARIHCSCILPIIYIYIYKNIEKEEED